jgi:hypothetical protein
MLINPVLICEAASGIAAEIPTTRNHKWELQRKARPPTRNHKGETPKPGTSLKTK